MEHWGDYPKNSGIIHLSFNTLNQSGEPSVITSGGVAILNHATRVETSGTAITLSGDINSRNGFHILAINTANAAIVNNNIYSAFFTSGTVDSVNVGNRTIGQFSIGKALTPIVENNYTLQDSLKLILSSAAGPLSGASGAGNTIYIRDINDTVNRITAQVTSSGDRLSVITDLS
jgi:hypothetical protein